MTICVADTNVIGFPTPRRLLSGISVQLGNPFFATPTVAREGVKIIRRAEEIHWLERMKEFDLPASVKSSVFAAVGNAAEEWAEELLHLDEGWLRPICTTSEKQMDAALFTLEIPKEAFISPRPMNYAQDMAIVCEAIAGGADMMITSNMDTIDHAMLNRWVIDSGLRNSPVLYSPDYGISELLGEFKAEYAHVAAITMGLSRSSRPKWEEHESLMRFTRGLEVAFSHLATVIRHEELRSDNTPVRWELARSNLLRSEWEEVRRLEEDRILRTRAAAREAGFDFDI